MAPLEMADVQYMPRTDGKISTVVARMGADA
ncbi:hypothetical protein BH11GEM1_BH11GEM1_11360 [soil metagenome]